MPRLLIDQRGISLEYESDCVIIRGENRRQTIPISRIEQLICFHNTVVSTQLLGQLVKRGIDFVVVNQRYENSSLSIISDQQHNVMRRCQQYEWHANSDNKCTTHG
ncbi:CRISPR-associated endonuclease Cas1 [Pseudidiomarina sediminum]|uniref:CRISPR-associated endonuclease Cas1 n=1 Tax=Pseudidiomarina sediminum TaxID=431675 RepID=UPI001C957277|nr:CRISPR-associated endonuclease Cas1 [Pseudidiomarina sediminum]